MSYAYNDSPDSDISGMLGMPLQMRKRTKEVSLRETSLFLKTSCPQRNMVCFLLQASSHSSPCLILSWFAGKVTVGDAKPFNELLGLLLSFTRKTGTTRMVRSGGIPIHARG